MMEDPRSWNVHQKAIAEAQREHQKLVTLGRADCTEVTAIYRKLLDKGLLKEAPKEG